MNDPMNDINDLTNPDPTPTPTSNSVQNENVSEVLVGGECAGEKSAECKTQASLLNYNSSDTSTLSRSGGVVKIDCRAVQAPNPAPLNSVVKGVGGAEKMQSSKTMDTQTVSLSLSTRISLERSDKITDYSKLNRSDLGELERHFSLLSPQQTNLIRTVKRKRELYPQRYRDDYLRHSSILLLSNGWSSAQRYSMCSVPNSVNRSGQCRLHKFCPYCSFLEKQHALARYVPVYESGIWFFLTGSFCGDLNMTGPSSYYELASYWDAYKSGLQKLVKDKLIRGVFWTEELAVNNIAPVQVLPHIHATIEADEMNDEMLIELKNSVVSNLKSVLGPECLAPNIQVKNLNSQRKLLSHLQYQIKPIKLVKAYDLAWSRALHNDRAGAVRLNSETTDLVLGYSHITNRRTKINYAGNLSPKAKMYIGTRDRDRKAAEAIVTGVMREGVDYIEVEEPDELLINDSVPRTFL